MGFMFDDSSATDGIPSRVPVPEKVMRGTDTNPTAVCADGLSALPSGDALIGESRSSGMGATLLEAVRGKVDRGGMPAWCRADWVSNEKLEPSHGAPRLCDLAEKGHQILTAGIPSGNRARE
jgi:hypothetical protein